MIQLPGSQPMADFAGYSEINIDDPPRGYADYIRAFGQDSADGDNMSGLYEPEAADLCEACRHRDMSGRCSCLWQYTCPACHRFMLLQRRIKSSVLKIYGDPLCPPCRRRFCFIVREYKKTSSGGNGAQARIYTVPARFLRWFRQRFPTHKPRLVTIAKTGSNIFLFRASAIKERPMPTVIELARASRSLTQGTIARMLGVDPSLIGKIFRQEIRASEKVARGLENILGVPESAWYTAVAFTDIHTT
jgi:hypothetical protein